MGDSGPRSVVNLLKRGAQQNGLQGADEGGRISRVVVGVSRRGQRRCTALPANQPNASVARYSWREIIRGLHVVSMDNEGEGWLSASLLVILALGWPFPVWENNLNTGLTVGIVNAALFAFVWRSCSKPGFSYWRGLEVIANSFASGWPHIGLPLLLAVYPISMWYALKRFWTGADAGQEWLDLATMFHEHRLFR